MKTTEPIKNDKQERETRMRAIIRKEAFALMAERGIDEVSMREIAEKVQVTKPVLYYYFKNKEDLCRSIMDEHVQQFNQILDDAYSKGLSAEELLKTAFRSHRNFFEQDPVNSKFIIRMISYTLDHREHMPKESEKPNEKLELYFKNSEKKGEIAKNGSGDVGKLASAVCVQMMLSAYIHQNVLPESKRCERFDYSQETLDRLVKIILLGVNQYYKENEK